jgi:hypothetical protein
MICTGGHERDSDIAVTVTNIGRRQLLLLARDTEIRDPTMTRNPTILERVV